MKSRDVYGERSEEDSQNMIYKHDTRVMGAPKDFAQNQHLKRFGKVWGEF